MSYHELDLWLDASPIAVHIIKWVIFLIFWNSFTKMLFRAF